METITKSIEQQNRLIAEFMGFEVDGEYFITPQSFYWVQPNIDYLYIGDLHFHKDWNWLMLVINEIARQTEEPETLDHYMHITIHGGQIAVSTDIQGVYSEVVEIIENIDNG